MASAKSIAKEEYEKELRRIKTFIRRAEKKGFVFDEKIIPKKPKNITQASVKKLKKITPIVLYSKAVPETEEAKKIKAKKVSKKEKIIKSKKSDEWEKIRRKQDRRDINNLKNPNTYREFSQEELIFQKINEIILTIEESGHIETGEYFKNLVNEEISRYGRRNFLRAAGQIENGIWEEIEMYMKYYGGVSNFDRGVHLFYDVLTGVASTIDTEKELSEVIDSDEDFESD